MDGESKEADEKKENVEQRPAPAAAAEASVVKDHGRAHGDTAPRWGVPAPDDKEKPFVCHWVGCG